MYLSPNPPPAQLQSAPQATPQPLPSTVDSSGSDDSDSPSSPSASRPPSSPALAGTSVASSSAGGQSDHASSDNTKKCKKNVREKRRRSELNTKFDTLRDLLHMGERKNKVEKTHILSEAIHAIQQLRNKQKSELTLQAKVATASYPPPMSAYPSIATPGGFVMGGKGPTAASMAPTFQLPTAPMLSASLSGGDHSGASMLQQLSALSRQQQQSAGMPPPQLPLHPSQLTAAAQQSKLSTGSPSMSPTSVMAVSPTPAPGTNYYQPQQQTTPNQSPPFIHQHHPSSVNVAPQASNAYSPFSTPPSQLSNLSMQSLSHPGSAGGFSAGPPTFTSSGASLPQLGSPYSLHSMQQFYQPTSSSSVSLFQSQPQQQLLAQHQQHHQQQQQHQQHQQQQLQQQQQGQHPQPQ